MNWSFELVSRRGALLAALALSLAACKGDKGDPGDPGPVGPAGPAGATGLTGPQGASGPGGKNSLTLSTVEPAGSNCATGGVKVDFGLDANDNGVLDPSEIDTLRTQYLCAGPQGPQGLQGATGATGANGRNSLAATTTEAPGSNCATGGVKLEYGVDADGNGTLDPGEIDASLTRYVCNGAQGPQGIQGATGAAGTNGTNGANGLNSLSATSVEPSGSNCATGGVRLDYGLDANGNGALDPGEVNVSLTRYVCNGAQGPQGPQGLQGATGATGAAGANGLNSLSATAVEPAGSNCSTGGMRVDYGVDANSNGVLDAAEVNASLRRYVCNGAQGPQGATGPAGATGSLGAYGDGSAGALSVTVNTDWNANFPGASLQFTDFSVAAGVTLTVPSGTIIRATGNVTINGTIVVAPGTSDNGQLRPPPGVSISAATTTIGGVAIPRLTAVNLVRLPAYGGGAGARNPNCTGGEGGGSFAIFAKGTLTVGSGGTIMANGRDSVNLQTTGVAIQGGGGGAGGVIVLIGKTGLTLASGSAVRANGGNGASGFDGNGGNSEGGGGGGGGGIIHLLSSAAPVTTGATISFTGGTFGALGGAGPTTTAGAGGGACGGNGGTGGTTGVAATAGASGYQITTTTPTPESLVL